MGEQKPPAWAAALVEWVVPAGRSREGLLGDLEERFQRRLVEGVGRARRAYVREALAAAARYAAHVAGSKVSFVREGGSMEGWMRDLRLGVRSLWHHPRFSGLVVATLALGIGASVAVFSVVHAVLMAPLPYPAADQLVMIDQMQTTGFRASVAIPMYEDWRDRTSSFETFAMEKPESMRVDGDEGAQVLEGRLVLGAFFESFRIQPVLGRLPDREDLGPGAERIAVLTDGFWQSRFGGDENAIGRTLRIEGEPFRVAAVLPTGFNLDPQVSFYLPLGLRADDPAWTDRGTSFGGWVVARLRDGTSVEQARNELSLVTEELRAEWGRTTPGAAVLTMRDWYAGDVSAPLMFLMGGVALVFLIACGNVAGLLLGRAEERGDEWALHMALGAGRGRLIRASLAQVFVLATLGGILGLGLGAGLLTLLRGALSSMTSTPFLEGIVLDGSVLLWLAGAILAVTIACGLAPFLGRRGQLAKPRRDGWSNTRARLRGGLVSAELALCVAVLACTGLLVKSVGNLQSVDPGFSPDGVLVQRMSMPSDRYESREAIEAARARIDERVRAIPGVRGVAFSNLYPFSGTNWEMLFRDPDTWPAEDAPSVLYTAATTDYFDVFSIELIRGRLFTEADRGDAPPVVIVDETAAALAWPGEDPIGKRVSVDDVLVDGEYVPLWRTVVGVVPHVRNYDLARVSRIEAYVPLAQSGGCCRTTWLSIKSDGDVEGLTGAVRAAVTEVDPAIPLYRVDSMRSVLQRETGLHRAVRGLFVCFGLLALILAMVGVYGVVSALANRRTREIGVRMALGATPGDAARTVASDGVRWIALGLFPGLLVAVAGGRAMGALLVEVAPWDPLVLGGSAVVLAITAAAAAWVPSRRVASLGPAGVLKGD